MGSCIVNRAFENRTQWNSIEPNRSIKLGNDRTKSNTELRVGSISEPIEPNRTQSIRLRSISSTTTEPKGLRLIVFGEERTSLQKVLNFA